MHIKTIRIVGFKSHRDTVVELHPGHNIVVGRNGSGKSNVFAAIRFVLGDGYDNLRPEDRQDLLHEGSSERTLSSMVEIVLDNTDGRVPLEGDEVVLRRTVGPKKDEYFLNAKKVTRGEITSTLDSAGFSRSNPYYMVQQNRITALTNMSDEQRLQLLKEVAGTHVYEERRRESMDILQDTELKRQQIEKVIDSMQSRLEELEGERAELAKYQKLERSKRAVEYALYAADLEKATATLKELDDARAAETRDGDMKQLVDKLVEEVSKAEKSIAALRADVAALQSERSAAEAALPKLMKQRVKLGQKVTSLQERMASDDRDVAQAAQTLVKVEAEIETKRRQLADAVLPAHAAAVAACDSAKAKVDSIEASCDALYEKQNRGQRFKSKKERDAHLQALIKDVRTNLAKQTERAGSLHKEAVTLQEKARKAGAEADKLEASASERSTKADSLRQQGEQLVAQRKAASADLHEAKRTADALEKECSELHNEEQRFEAGLYSNMPAAVKRGLEEIRKLMDPGADSHIAGIHGALYDLFKPKKETFHAAVEAVAGPDLFNVVVNDEVVASKVIAHLSQTRSGRVTLVPLNRVQAQGTDVPPSAECVPLMQVLEYDEAYAKAVKQVFGRALLCKNMEIASSYARSRGLTCVTLDGDLANKRGALSGGYVDSSSTRLKSVAGLYGVRAKLAERRQAREQADTQARAAEAKSLTVQNAHISTEEQRRKMREDATLLSQDAERRRNDESALRDKAAEAERQASQVNAEVSLLQQRLQGLEAELAADLTTQLSPAEEAQLQSLTKQLESARAAFAAATKEKESSRQAKQELETVLHENLLRQAAELRSKCSQTVGHGAKAMAASDMRDELSALQRELEEAEATERAVNERLEKAQTTIASKEASTAAAQSQLEGLRAQLSAARDQLTTESVRQDKFAEKLNSAVAARDEAEGKLRDIGTVPAPELDAIKALKRKALLDRLSTLNSELRAFSHVNKKAGEQHEVFHQQREELQKRKDELDRGDASIRTLIDTLDNKKDEAIQRTFNGVKKHFSDVFAELVPKGSATLKILTRADAGANANAGSSKRKSAGAAAEVELFTGLSITASFSDAGETRNINALSGGQKSLVALALMFAIQRADPAPFYVFDEIDSALDAVHRASVSALIQKQSHNAENPAQFISSTFSPEMCECADKFFGVVLEHKTSSVIEQTQDDCIAFVHAINEEERLKQQQQQQGAGSAGDVGVSPAVARDPRKRVKVGSNEADA